MCIRISKTCFTIFYDKTDNIPQIVEKIGDYKIFDAIWHNDG